MEKVKLEIFEGPLDLLLFLIKKEEIDIYDIPIVKITNQYLEYLDLMKMLDLDAAGEFLLMASTLLYIKSKMLLPQDEQYPDDDSDDLDPRSELIEKLVEYRKFKEIADDLEKKEQVRKSLFMRGVEEDVGPAEIEIVDVGIFDLLSALSDVLKRIEEQNETVIFEDEVTVVDKICMIEEMLSVSKRFKFTDLFIGVTSRMEVIVTFMALLELIKLKKLSVKQRKNFGEIDIVMAE